MQAIASMSLVRRMHGHLASASRRRSARLVNRFTACGFERQSEEWRVEIKGAGASLHSSLSTLHSFLHAPYRELSEQAYRLRPYTSSVSPTGCHLPQRGRLITLTVYGFETSPKRNCCRKAPWRRIRRQGAFIFLGKTPKSEIMRSYPK